jgi:transposase
MKQGKTISGQALGIDVSKNKLDCCYVVQSSDKHVAVKGTKSFDNTTLGFKKLIEWAGKKMIKDMPLTILMEATGCYHENILEFLADNFEGAILVLVQGNMAKNFAKSLNRYSKTDKIDAKILAQLAIERVHRPWKATPKNIRIIRDLLRQRVKLICMQTQLKNQRHAYSYGSGRQDINIAIYTEILDSLAIQIKKIGKAVKLEAQKDAALSKNITLLETIPGIGTDTALCILAETNQFINYTSASKVISYAGYDILQCQSGTHVGKTRMSKKGNKYIRRQLYCPAQSHINARGKFTALYERLKGKNKKTLQASVAVQMRLLRLMFSMVKIGKCYDAEHQHQTLAKTA